MQKQIRNIVIAISAFLSFQNYGQTVQLKLADSLLIKGKPKIVILKQNEKFLVITTPKLYVETCNAKNNEARPFDALLQYIQKNDKPVLDISVNQEFSELNNEIFQSLILGSQCLVYNKSSRKLEKKVFEDYYKPNDLSLEYKTESDFIVLIKTEHER